jgi:Arc/MetJ-type ribon-helix-helix transcriptional regulator
MKTINISVTTEQYGKIESLVKEKGYANRSEFFRSLIRTVVKKPEVISESDEFTLESPPTRSIKKIMKGFRDTQKYSDKFLQDLEDGMRDSQYFK